MTEIRLRRCTGMFGLVAALISLIPLPLYFMHEGAPRQWNILARIMVSIVGSTVLIIFLVGFRLVMRRNCPSHFVVHRHPQPVTSGLALILTKKRN